MMANGIHFLHQRPHAIVVFCPFSLLSTTIRACCRRQEQSLLRRSFREDPHLDPKLCSNTGLWLTRKHLP
jgi:hypothetical protein